MTGLLSRGETPLPEAGQLLDSADLMRDAFGVRISYLEATLEEIDSRYGTIERYFSAGLGLSTQTIDSMRERFVR